MHIALALALALACGIVCVALPSLALLSSSCIVVVARCLALPSLALLACHPLPLASWLWPRLTSFFISWLFQNRTICGLVNGTRWQGHDLVMTAFSQAMVVS